MGFLHTQVHPHHGFQVFCNFSANCFGVVACSLDRYHEIVGVPGQSDCCQSFLPLVRSVPFTEAMGMLSRPFIKLVHVDVG
jgi:hypothetical protein